VPLTGDHAPDKVEELSGLKPTAEAGQESLSSPVGVKLAARETSGTAD
jgi:hypothetical protein